MNKIKIFSLMLIAAAFAACDDHEGDDYINSDGIKVVSRQISMDAVGGTGKVVVDKNVAKAYSNEEWLTVTSNGQEVSLVAVSNPNRESRNANLVIKASETDSVIVSVSQYGLVFDASAAKDITISDAAYTTIIPIKTSGVIELVSAPDWVKTTVVDEGLQIEVAANTTGDLRAGDVVFGVSGNEASFNILQGEWKDLNGNYYFGFTDSSSGKVSYFLATLTYESASKVNIAFPSLGFNMEAKPVSGQLAYTVSAGTYLGDFQGYNIHTCLWDTDAGYLTWNNAVSYTCTFAYDSEEGYTYAEFTDNGSWSNYNVSALRLEAFTSMTLGSDTRYGLLVGMVEPFMEKMYANESNAKKALGTKASVKSFK